MDLSFFPQHWLWEYPFTESIQRSLFNTLSSYSQIAMGINNKNMLAFINLTIFYFYIIESSSVKINFKLKLKLWPENTNSLLYLCKLEKTVSVQSSISEVRQGYILEVHNENSSFKTLLRTVLHSNQDVLLRLSEN